MLKQQKWWIVVCLSTLCLFVCDFVIMLPSGNATTLDEKRPQEILASVEDPEQEPHVSPELKPVESETDTYLFVHDTSKNMRRKKRIPLMQDSMRRVLDNLPVNATVGLQVFGHRFSLDGPDACEDTEMLVPFDRLALNRDDFETQFNLLSDPPLGGGAPVGFSLRQAMEDIGVYSGMKEIFLYFPSESDALLHPEARPIRVSLSILDEIKQTLQELVKGSSTGLVSPLPASTEIRGLYLTDDGVAFVDFSKDVDRPELYGAEAELLTIYSVVNTLTQNFKSVKKVFILVDGGQMETLGGHVDLSRAFLPLPSLIAR